MPATAEAPATAVSVLGEETMPVAEVLALLPPAALSQAWARGEVEFGHRAFVVVGSTAKDDARNRRLVVEAGWKWTGAKKPTHRSFRELWAAEGAKIPECAEYVEYREGDEKADPNKSPLATITRGEAVRLTALCVKLTDKGLGAIDAAA